MTPKQAAITYWGNDNPPLELIAAISEAQKSLLKALDELIFLAEVAMIEANNNGSGFDINAALADARSAIAKAKGETA